MAVVPLLMSSSDQDPIGHRIIRLDSVDSTNNYAAKLLYQGDLVHGSVIMADEQTEGRGQRGSTWTSKAGENLTLTIVLKPANLSVTKQFVLTQFASLAVRDTLLKYGMNGEIKWPNDLYVGNRKIAGMLIENQVTNSGINSVLLGIGLNVNQVDFQEFSATSFYNETGIKQPLMEVAMSLFSSLQKFWNHVIGQQFEDLNEQYQNVLYLKDKLSPFTDEEGDFLGTIKGTTENGLLSVAGRNNELRNYDLKELKFRQQNDL